MDSPERLFEADQSDRHKLKSGETNWDEVSGRDKYRLDMAYVWLKKLDSMNSRDLYYLSFIFQHGPNIADIENALMLAKKSLLGGYKEALWMVCGSYDRLLIRRGLLQVYGSQYKILSDGTKKTCEIDPSIADEDLALMGLPTKKDFESLT